MEDKRKIDQKRLEALDVAVAINLLLDKRYFPKVLFSAENNKPELFEKVCDEADIQKDMARYIEGLIFKNSVKDMHKLGF